jgi:hypothetical protein
MRSRHAALLACAAIAWPATVVAEDEKPLRALLVCGGCCHDYARQKAILTKGISARAQGPAGGQSALRDALLPCARV